MSYYDPFRTRSNHRYKYTHKGQVIQAKIVNTPRCIEQDQIQLYRNFFLSNPQYGLTKIISNYPYIIDGISFSQVGQETINRSFSSFSKNTEYTEPGSLGIFEASVGKSFVFSYIQTSSGFFFACQGFEIRTGSPIIEINPPPTDFITYPCTVHSILISKSSTTSSNFMCGFHFPGDKPDETIGSSQFLLNVSSDYVIDTWFYIPNSVYLIQ